MVFPNSVFVNVPLRFTLPPQELFIALNDAEAASFLWDWYVSTLADFYIAKAEQGNNRFIDLEVPRNGRLDDTTQSHWSTPVATNDDDNVPLLWSTCFDTVLWVLLGRQFPPSKRRFIRSRSASPYH